MESTDKKSFSEIIKNHKKAFTFGAIAVLGIAVILIIIFCVGYNKNKAENTVSDTVTTSHAQTTENSENKASGTVSVGTTAATVIENGSNTYIDGIQEIKLNETVSNEDFDLTLNSVKITYRVQPDNPPSYYHYYDAPDNEVYIYVNASIKNKKKNSVDCDAIYSVQADYNDGYKYDGFNIADDDDGDFTYANITEINPLQTRGVHCLIGCPEEIETSDAPLILTITLRGGGEYKYTIR